MSIPTPKQLSQIMSTSMDEKARRPLRVLLPSSIMAGLFIGLAFVFYITVTLHPAIPGSGITKLVGGGAFSLGLILCVIMGVDLFTSSVMSILPCVEGKLSTAKMLRYWIIVYLGNVIGALLLVLLMMNADQALASHGQWGLATMNIASYKLHHSWSAAFTLGILCNLMVCLAVWMSAAGTSVADKTIAIFFPVAMFVACGFEHSIANTFLVPYAIIVKDSLTPDQWMVIGKTAADFDNLNWVNFINMNLIPVTLGNIVGGAGFIALTHWFMYLRKTPES